MKTTKTTRRVRGASLAEYAFLLVALGVGTVAGAKTIRANAARVASGATELLAGAAHDTAGLPGASAGGDDAAGRTTGARGGLATREGRHASR
ncbi:MAG: hypothetical protein KF782_32100 [Labilithrix sp.]|nr:hypothetical protein [Labilithrix sp.]